MKKAESLPPSKRRVEKMASSNSYKHGRHLKRRARLAEQRAQKGTECQVNVVNFVIFMSFGLFGSARRQR